MVSLIGGSNINALEVRLHGDSTDLERALGSAAGAIGMFRAQVATLGTAIGIGTTAALYTATRAAESWNQEVRNMAQVTDIDTAEELEGDIRELSTSMPIATEELARMTTEAARFGIEGSDNLMDFVETVGMMATATTLSTDEAGEAFAKLSELTDTPIDDIERLGATINILENNMAAGADEIVRAGLRSSAALNQLGMSTDEIMALNAAILEVYESPQRAGTAIRRLVQDMMDPRRVSHFAEALGVTEDEFVAMRDEDPTGTIMSIVDVMAEGGEQADELSGNLTSLTDRAIRQLVQNQEGLEEALELTNEEWEEANSLQEEFGIQSDSLTADLQILWNTLRDVAITVGNAVVPAIRDLVQSLTGAIEGFGEWVEASDGLVPALLLAGTAVASLSLALGAFAMIAGPLHVMLLGISLAALQIAATFAPAAAAVGLLATAFRTNFAGIRDVVMDIVGVLREEFQETVQTVRQVTEDLLPVIAQFWTDTGEEMEMSLEGVVRFIGDIVIDTIRLFGEVTRNVLRAIVPLTEAALGAVDAMWERHGDTVIATGEALGAAIDVIRTQFQRLPPEVQATILVTGALAASLGGLLGLLYSTTATLGRLGGALAFTLRNFVPLGGVIVKILAPLVQLSHWMYRLAAGFLSISKAAGTATGAKAVFGSVLAKLGFSTGMVVGMLKLLAGALKILLGPVGLVIAGIAALAIAFQTNFLGMRDAVIGFVDVFHEYFSNAIEVTRSNLQEIISIFEERWSEIEMVIDNAMEVVHHAIDETLGEIERLWSIHGDEIMADVRRMAEGIVLIIGNLLNLIAPIFNAIFSIIISTTEWGTGHLLTLFEWWLDRTLFLWNRWGDEIVVILNAAITIVIGIVSTFVDLMITLFRMFTNTVSNLVMAVALVLEGDLVGAFWALTDAVFGSLGLLLDFFIRTFEGIVNYIISWGPRLLSAIGTILMDAWNLFLQWGRDLIFGSLIPRIFEAILEYVQDALYRLGDIIREALIAAAEAVYEIFTRIYDTVSEMISSMVEFATRTFTTFLETTTTIFNAIRDSIANSIQAIYDTVTDTISNTVEFVTDAFNDMRDRVLDTIDNLRDSSVDTLENLQDRAIDIVENIRDTATDAWETLQDNIESVVESVQETVESSWDAIEDAVSSAMDTILETVESGWNTIEEAIEAALDSILTQVENWASDTYDTITGMVEDVASWIQETGSTIMGNAWDSMAQSAVDAFNSVMPDSITFPEVSIGGGSLDLPEAEVAGETIGGGSMNVPRETFGGQSWDLPQLHDGGLVKKAGLAEIHEGEEVVPAAEVDEGYENNGNGAVNHYDITIDASSYGEGRAAAHAFKDELRSKNFD